MRLHTQQNLALILIILLGKVFALAALAKAFLGGSIRAKNEAREVKTLHGWLKESTTEFGNMLEKRLEVYLFYYHLLCLLFLPHTHLQTSFLVYCLHGTFPTGKPYLHITVSFRGFFLSLSFTFLESHAGIRGEE